MSADYSEVTVSHRYVDNAAMQLVYRPDQFDDLLSDEASMITGALGRPSATESERSSF